LVTADQGEEDAAAITEEEEVQLEPGLLPEIDQQNSCGSSSSQRAVHDQAPSLSSYFPADCVVSFFLQQAMSSKVLDFQQQQPLLVIPLANKRFAHVRRSISFWTFVSQQAASAAGPACFLACLLAVSGCCTSTSTTQFF